MAPQIVDSPQMLPSGVRAQLEDIGERLGLATGRHRLVLEYQEGRIKWFETVLVRAPASRLDELAARAPA